MRASRYWSRRRFWAPPAISASRESNWEASASDGSVKPAQRIACDTVLMSGGATPCVHLFSQSRGKLQWREDMQTFLPGQSAERERSAGACRGLFELGAALNDGSAAGLDALPESLRSGAAATYVVDAPAAGRCDVFSVHCLPQRRRARTNPSSIGSTM